MSGETMGMGAQLDTLTVAYRAWSERAERRTGGGEGTGGSSRKGRKQEAPWPGGVLVLDCETTTDERQNLTFGVYRLYRWGEVGGVWRLRCVEEGLFHADDLPETDPAGYDTLTVFAHSHRAEVGRGADDTLHVRSRRAFVKDVFYPAAWEAQALVVGFNLPFDLSRLAVGWHAARGEYEGGFSLTLKEHEVEETGERRPDYFRPHVRIKPIDSKRALIGFGGVRGGDGESGAKEQRGRGRFLDARTLAYALTDKAHSLASAARAFGLSVQKTEPPDGHGIITPGNIEYARNDVEVTAALLEKLRAEYDRHPALAADGGPLKPDKVLSSASLAKGYLGALGVTPPLARWPDFPREQLGQAMAAFYGGRAECRIRKAPVPVVHTDFLSMYPTVNVLIGTWRVLTAERCDVVDATDDVRAMLDGVTPEAVLSPDFWAGLLVFAEIEPAGDVLPVRAAYAADGGELGIGVNPYHDEEPRWYALPDLVASALLTGRAPRVRRAWRLVPSDRLPGLRPVALAGVVEVDPGQDFFKGVIEERRRVKRRADLAPEERARLDKFLKVLANSGAYGIYSQFDRKETREDRPDQGRAKTPRRIAIHSGNAHFTRTAQTTEDHGTYCFPPVAALITAAARLMLALLERLVTDAGGSYAFCDTDSMAIVASRDGGLVPCPGGPHRFPDGREAVRALSWAGVDAIVARFAALNPYDRDAVPGSVLKVEDVNYETVTGPDGEKRRHELWCYAISAKRYALYTLGYDGTPVLWGVVDEDEREETDDEGSERAPTLVDSKEHGLGHLLNPTDPEAEDRAWIDQLWEMLVRDVLGLPVAEPPWLDRPAVMRLTASSPRLLSSLVGRELAYADGLKPFNFIMAAFVGGYLPHYPRDADPAHFRLIAPFAPDARRWEKVKWTNLHDGQRYHVTARDWESRPPDTARVQTYRDVLTAYRNHPERKSAGPDGTPCGQQTVGLLRRRAVQAGRALVVGKEANRLDDDAAEFVGVETCVLTWDDGEDALWRRAIAPLLAALPMADLAAACGLSPRQLRAVAAGRSVPHPGARAALLCVAGAEARRRLAVAGRRAPARFGLEDGAWEMACCVAALGTAALVGPACAGCGQPFTPTRAGHRFCSDRCRKAGRRAGQQAGAAPP